MKTNRLSVSLINGVVIEKLDQAKPNVYVPPVTIKSKIK